MRGWPRRSVRTAPSGRERERDGERGSALVDFVLVSALVTVLFVGVLQLALTLHVRNTLIDCAAEGARHGALAGSSPAAGAQRTRDLIASAVSSHYAGDVGAAVTTYGGLPVVEVTVVAPLPVLGLLGPGGALSVAGRAVAEAG